MFTCFFDLQLQMLHIQNHHGILTILPTWVLMEALTESGQVTFFDFSYVWVLSFIVLGLHCEMIFYSMLYVLLLKKALICIETY